MAIPPARKAPAAPAPEEVADLLQILVSRKTLTREQAERVRRHSRTTAAPVVQTIVKLGLATEVQIAEALAVFAGLRFVKINPLELDLEVVTGALSGPFARKHGIVAIAKTDEKLTVAVHDPFAPFPPTTSSASPASSPSSASSPRGRTSRPSTRASTISSRA